MQLPTETEYDGMLARLKDVMQFVAEELEQLANGVKPGLSKTAADNIISRLRLLVRGVAFKVGNDPSNPVPTELPTLVNTPTPDVPD